MQVTFDLISDLHLESWPDFDWTGQATSPICVVAGDVSRDPILLMNALNQLSRCYHAVFYIDGNEEHKNNMLTLGDSYRDLSHMVNSVKNVTFLQDNVVVIDGVAIIGTNGWWGFDLDPNLDMGQSMQWYKDNVGVPVDPASILAMSRTDAAYLINSIQRLQTHNDVRKIAIVTHTVPGADLIDHDIELCDTWNFNCMGNRLLRLAHNADTEKKIHTWCFGHYHGSVDRIIDNVRYVNNCRGKGNTNWSRSVYYPKRITIEF